MKVDMSPEAIIDRMSDDDLSVCWQAIWSGGLRDNTGTTNGIPTNDWVEMIYSEMGRRGIKR